MEKNYNPEKFGKIALWLQVAKDEIETIIAYTTMYGDVKSDQQSEIRPHLDEIIGDEFNHALIGLLSAAVALGIKIPTDELDELIEQAFAEESDDGD